MLKNISPRFAIAVALFLLAVALLIHAAMHWVRVDDAYIAFRYAESLARGDGLVFNPGERVEGYTDFLWVLLLAGLHRLGASTPVAAQVLGSLAGVATLLATYFMGRRALGLTTPHSLAACALLAASAPLAMWMGAGLETALYGLLFTLALGQIIVDARERPAFPRSGVLFGLAALTRPEAIGLFAVAATLSARRLGLRCLARAVAGFAALVVPHFIFRLLYYGDLLPNTFYAKMSPGTSQLLAGLAYTKSFALAHAPMLVLIPFGLWRKSPAVAGARLAAFVLAVVALYVVAVGGDFYFYARFFTPYLPCLAALFCLSVMRLGELLPSRGEQRPSSLAPMTCAALVIAAAVLPKVLYDTRDRHQLSAVRRGAEMTAAVAEELRATRSPRTLIAVSGLGLLPYLTGFPTIDMLGLADRTVAHSTAGKGHVGHQKSNVEYVLSRKPDLVIFEYAWMPVARDGPPDVRTDTVVRFVQTAGSWNAITELLSNREFRHDYAVQLITIQGKQAVSFVRDSTLSKLEDRARQQPGNPRAQFELAMRYRHQGLLDEALATMQKVAALQPAALGPRLNLAYFYYEADRVQEALAEFRRLATLFQQQPDVRYGIALCLHRLGRYVEAIGEWRTFLSIAPRSTYAPRALEKLAEAERLASGADSSR